MLQKQAEDRARAEEERRLREEQKKALEKQNQVAKPLNMSMNAATGITKMLQVSLTNIAIPGGGCSATSTAVGPAPVKPTAPTSALNKTFDKPDRVAEIHNTDSSVLRPFPFRFFCKLYLNFF